MLVFTADVSQNQYLSEGTAEMHAVVTVTAADGAGAQARAGGTPAVEVIILDCSGSMSGAKIHEARRAAGAALDTLRDSVSFAVVAGNHLARTVYPAKGGLATASKATRQAAKKALAELTADGGTAIGAWLTHARGLMLTRPEAVHHAILLTDGQNGEEPAELTRAVSQCEGVFQCDCRGVGADWRVAELRRIATALLGSVDLLRSPQDMAADFRALVEAAMGRELDGVVLRVWSPRGSTVRFLRQVLPEVDDLTARASESAPLTRDYPTGAWGAGTRAYHLCVDIPPAPVGAKKLAARVSLVVGDEVLSTAQVLAEWTDDVDLSTRIDHTVAHYTGQAELAQALQEGLAARRDGDVSTAVNLLGKAARLAAEASDDVTLQRLDKVVEIEDAATGRVALRRDVDLLDEMDLDAKSTRTVRAPRQAEVCPVCSEPRDGDAAFCGSCGHSYFGEGGTGDLAAAAGRR